MNVLLGAILVVAGAAAMRAWSRKGPYNGKHDRYFNQIVNLPTGTWWNRRR
jgi:hypothetical protein